MMLIFLALIVAVGFLAYSHFRRREGGRSPFEPERREEEPLEIARRRYARGEISREEFERIKRDLEDHRREP
jgi:putative membrane protein